MSIENLQSRPIYVRSPYDVVIDEPLQIEGRVELFIWNEGDTPPTTPTYLLEKKIPSPTNLRLIFNVQNYVREFIEWEKNQIVSNQPFIQAPTNEWCFVKVKRYTLLDGEPDFELLDTTTYIALDGWGTYEQGGNPSDGDELGIEGAGAILLAEGTYQYLWDDEYTVFPFNQPYGYRYGDVTVVNPEETYAFRYTDLKTGATIDIPYINAYGDYVAKMYLVYPGYQENGNKVEWIDSLGRVFWTAIMTPVCEPKFSPITMDFVNKYGAWQRTFFFKVSKKSLSTTRDEYDFLAREIASHNRNLPQRRQYNVNGIQKIKVNTGWVENETYNDIVLIQMMLSEEIRIALNDFVQINELQTNPVKMLTSNTELFENINMHLINYELEFEYAYDYINNVV